MAWMPIDQHIGRNPKTLALARRLKWTPRYTVGFLVDLWGWAIDNCPSGMIADVPPATVAKAVGLPPADVATVVGHMGGVGFIDQVGPSAGRFHEWDDWGGRIVVTREKERVKKANRRAKSTLSPGTHSPVPGDRDEPDALLFEGVSRGTDGPGPWGRPPVRGREEGEKRRVPPSPTRSAPPERDVRALEARAGTAAEAATRQAAAEERQREDEYGALIHGMRPEWGAVLTTMRVGGISRGQVITWFRGSDVEQTATGYVVRIANAFSLEWVSTKLRRQIHDAIVTVFGEERPSRVEFALVGADLNGHGAPPDPGPTYEEAKQEPAIVALDEDDEPGFADVER